MSADKRSADEQTLVHLAGVSKRFGSVVAVDDLDITIRAGEFVTFLGPSGCGKTTTLRILGGFEKPDRGRVVLDGEDVTDLPPNKRNVNMVFQDYALFPHMSVSQNIGFGLELKGLTRAQVDTRRDEVMRFLELDGFGDRHPEQLSGGQRQRVALARALAPDPALLLLDEPLGALDARLRGQVQQELKAIQRRTHTTFFFVTHDQDEALTMSDRIVVMNQGRVEQDGTPEQLYFQPASRFVAEFIGDTNLLNGTLLGSDEGYSTIDWFGHRLVGRRHERIAAQPELRIGDPVAASVRLECVVCQRTRPDTDNTVQGRIERRVFKGSRTEITARVDDAADAVLTAYVDRDTLSGLTDEALWLGWNRDSQSVLRS